MPKCGFSLSMWIKTHDLGISYKNNNYMRFIKSTVLQNQILYYECTSIFKTHILSIKAKFVKINKENIEKVNVS